MDFGISTDFTTKGEIITEGTAQKIGKSEALE